MDALIYLSFVAVMASSIAVTRAPGRPDAEWTGGGGVTNESALHLKFAKYVCDMRMLIDELDVLMNEPVSPGRGRKIAISVNRLEGRTDSAIYHAVGLDFRADRKHLTGATLMRAMRKHFNHREALAE